MAAPYYGMIDEVHVVLVDDDKEFVNNMVDLLKSYDYKVIVVGTALDAMAMLSKGKQKIDVMILNIHSSNTLSFHLLARVVALDIISLVVWDEQNELVVKKAFDEGAYLCLKKPFDKDITKYIWQFVVGEKLKREKARKGFENNKNQMNKIVKRKNCTEWTEALHAKFMEAVQLLGEGRCYPKEILEVMNVPGLTRMQVASHLQKCRRNDWRSPEERKSLHRPLGQGSSSDFHESRSSFKKFGTMPHLQIKEPNLNCNPNNTQRNSNHSFPNLSTNNTFAREESPFQQQFYRPQLHVQSPYLSNFNPFSNPFLSIQNTISGGLQQQQQQRPLFGMLYSQGLQGPIIKNTNYRSDVVINNGHHHTQSDYTLNSIVAQGATYSGNGIVSSRNIRNEISNGYNLNISMDNVTSYSSNATMCDTYVGNVAINGLEEANPNFQQYIGEPNISKMNNPFQKLEPPSASLHNEQDNDFDQVYYDD
ncbi:hypothetical protein P3L10_026811 [Capsicum annuum]